jgi:hypothetical protein
MNNFNFIGLYKTKNYFEGWYLRITDEDNHSYSFIFGITLYKDDPHSFIQIVDATEKKSYYFRFGVSDFYYNKDSIRIKDNIFGIHQLKISIEPFNIDLNINPSVFVQRNGLAKCAMGFFKHLPMATYHEIIFMKAKIEGTIKTENHDGLINGVGYMEKNFGCRFPKRWLWLQTNHFENYNASFILAQADLVGNCDGFFSILNVDGDEFRFATYNGFRIERSCIDNNIKVTIEREDICLIIKACCEPGNLVIAALKNGKMTKEVEESLTSNLTLSLYRGNELIFHDTATNVGCENLYPTDSK